MTDYRCPYCATNTYDGHWSNCPYKDATGHNAPLSPEQEELARSIDLKEEWSKPGAFGHEYAKQVGRNFDAALLAHIFGEQYISVSHWGMFNAIQTTTL